MTIYDINMYSQSQWHVVTMSYGPMAYGTFTMQGWLATTCPQILIVTLGDASIFLDMFALGAESYIKPELCTCMCTSVKYASVHARKCVN